MDTAELARAYYETIDGDEYERLGELLDPAFVQVRGDRTFESRDEFVRFMREDRPMTDTTHELHHVLADGDRVVVEGSLLDADGEAIFRFADAFTVADDRLTRLRTYTH